MISSTDMTTASGFLSMLRERESCPSAPWLLLQPGSAPWSAELQFRTMGVVPRRASSPNESCALLFPAALGDQHVRKAGCELQRRAGVSPAPIGFADGYADLETKTKPFLGVNGSQVQFNMSKIRIKIMNRIKTLVLS